ncbi:hypothetical protein E2C01_088102 [Portunus trituberculatus]|uniref:Uncharacterized protein n=1 Tax=Portunus trituberculatus TaxID=210409 RepID=A0A5B7JIA5_PORTR|nr:hypothetical protein [Portunus trituberculatus]
MCRKSRECDALDSFSLSGILPPLLLSQFRTRKAAVEKDRERWNRQLRSVLTEANGNVCSLLLLPRYRYKLRNLPCQPISVPVGVGSLAIRRI